MELGVRSIDFIQGYPATTGLLVYDPHEVVGNRTWLGRIKCLAAIPAHLICIPLSILAASVRSEAVPIFAEIKLRQDNNPSVSLTERIYVYVNEIADIVRSPICHMIGILRAASGVLYPPLYLKAPYVSTLSEGQLKDAASVYHQMYSPSARY